MQRVGTFREVPCATDTEQYDHGVEPGACKVSAFYFLSLWYDFFAFTIKTFLKVQKHKRNKNLKCKV